MSHNVGQDEQDKNTSKLVMDTFYEVASKDGTNAQQIAAYLQEKFGDVWRVSTLVGKAEETLNKCATLGFLDKRGDRYVANLARELRCGRRRRRRRSCRRKRKRRCGSKRRRRRRRRRRPCCCGK